MKSLYAYILFIAIMFSLMPVEQMRRMPVLIQHYQEHKQRDQHMDFIEYMVHHYSNQVHADDDQDRDTQLPFKSLEKSAQHFPVFNLAYRFTASFPVAFQTFSIPPVFSKQFLPSPLIKSLFKPPMA